MENNERQQEKDQIYDLEKYHIYNLIQEFQEKYQEIFDIKEIEKEIKLGRYRNERKNLGNR